MPSYSNPQYLAMFMKASSSGEDALYFIGFFYTEADTGYYYFYIITSWQIEKDSSMSNIYELFA